MDREVISEKLESLSRCVRRVTEKCPAEPEILLNDVDLQDIIALNLFRAVQLCVDIAAHIIADLDSEPPETMGQTFDILAGAGVLGGALASRLKKAVGFRNIAVHNYEGINWRIVHSIARHHVNDFKDFAGAVSARLDSPS